MSLTHHEKYGRKYYLKNRVAILAKQRKHRKLHPEVKSAWHKANPEYVKEHNRAYRALHRDELIAASKAYSASLPAEELKRQRYAGRMMYRYKLTPQAYTAMLKSQRYRCKLCRRRTTKFVIDHAHDCCPGRRSCGNCIRGLLCIPCNAGLGFIEKMGVADIVLYLYIKKRR
jgi:Recombination endonuclease VII